MSDYALSYIPSSAQNKSQAPKEEAKKLLNEDEIKDLIRLEISRLDLRLSELEKALNKEQTKEQEDSSNEVQNETLPSEQSTASAKTKSTKSK
ncbi:hypothetical protein DMB92_08160 [Campylobacter sp. MIT 99-7217]|uniref:hypothetical protein n=1 Tax=Campylobacter sp. MIT 99-7217 TaxID=535091 RepID=UPI001159D631|nr:hypothetical protein [Campylobacter sp. MIT 99-7217]TQR29326.1 hypothetical protein DMB92_08160 [Campylobacter sp. MIT 99-7217]